MMSVLKPKRGGLLLLEFLCINPIPVEARSQANVEFDYSSSHRKVFRVKNVQLAGHGAVIVHLHDSEPIPFRSAFGPRHENRFLHHVLGPGEVRLQLALPMIQPAEAVVKRMPTAHDGRNGGEVSAQVRLEHVEDAERVLTHRESFINAGELHVVVEQD